MRKTHYLAITATTLVLAACNSSVDPDKREPGKWKTEATLENLELHGVPAGMEAQVANMKQQMASQLKAQGAREECLTADASAKEDVSKGISQTMGSRCTFSKKEVGGGKIDVAGTCDASGQKMEMTMIGTMAPKKVDVLMNIKGQSMGGQRMDMKMRVVGTHVGKCDA